MRRLRGAAGETFASLRTRNFRLFFVGQLISQTGTWLTMIAQTLLVLRLTHNSGVAADHVATRIEPERPGDLDLDEAELRSAGGQDDLSRRRCPKSRWRRP